MRKEVFVFNFSSRLLPFTHFFFYFANFVNTTLWHTWTIGFPPSISYTSGSQPLLVRGTLFWVNNNLAAPWLQLTSIQTSSSEIGGTLRTFQGTQGLRTTVVHSHTLTHTHTHTHTHTLSLCLHVYVCLAWRLESYLLLTFDSNWASITSLSTSLFPLHFVTGWQTKAIGWKTCYFLNHRKKRCLLILLFI